MSGVHDDLATLRTAISGYSGTPVKWPDRGEALAALDRVEAELGRLTARRSRYAEGRYTACMEALSDAEARCARLQQALREIEESSPNWMVRDAVADNEKWMRDRAREALAGLDTPADSQEGKT